MSGPANLIAECTALVAGSNHVSVDAAALERAGEDIDATQLVLPTWDGPEMYDGPADLVLGWLMAYNAINYCYWSGPDGTPWWTEVGGEAVGKDDEALGVMAALGAAIRQGAPLSDGDWLAALKLSDLEVILRPALGAGSLPLMDMRLASLRELGRAYQRVGTPRTLIWKANGSASRLVDVLASECPRWDDSRVWRGTRMRFLKRAQLCTAMIYERFAGEGPGDFDDIKALTAFADYRLPQSLRAMGILRLSDELSHRIERHQLIPERSAEEIAIRAATVFAADQLRAVLARKHPHVDALVVDFLLWRSAVDNADRLPPFHRTRTTDY